MTPEEYDVAAARLVREHRKRMAAISEMDMRRTERMIKLQQVLIFRKAAGTMDDVSRRLAQQILAESALDDLENDDAA